MLILKFMKQKKLPKPGFTLVELLVVISIIGILSSFAVVSLNDARVKARDALRRGDTAQLRTALNLYYDDYGEYVACGSWDDNAEDFGATADCYNGDFTNALTGGSRPYMASIPRDPRNPNNDPEINNVYLYRYVSRSDGSEYALVYSLEDGGLKVMRGW